MATATKKKKKSSIPSSNPNWRAFRQGEVGVVRSQRGSTLFLYGAGEIVLEVWKRAKGASIMRPLDSFNKTSMWRLLTCLDGAEEGSIFAYDEDDYPFWLMAPEKGKAVNDRIALAVYEDYSVRELPYDDWKRLVDFRSILQFEEREAENAILFWTRTHKNEAPRMVQELENTDFYRRWMLVGSPGWNGYGNFAEVHKGQTVRFHLLSPTPQNDAEFAWKYDEDGTLSKVEAGFKCDEFDRNGRKMIFNGREVVLRR